MKKKNPITKATYRRKDLFGFTVPETGVHLGGKARQWEKEAESSCLNHAHKAEGTNWTWNEAYNLRANDIIPPSS